MSCTLNQWVDQLGPKEAPTLVGVNLWLVASLKSGRDWSGGE